MFSLYIYRVFDITGPSVVHFYENVIVIANEKFSNRSVDDVFNQKKTKKRG